MTDTTALAVHDQTALDLAPRMVVSLDNLRENLRQLDEFKRDIMVEGVDYGTIPGTPKPTLLKPGAEKLSLAFGLAPNFEPANRIEDWERGFFHYEERCVLVSRRSGQTVATANGSANSREPRYRWRDAKPTCPDCGMDLRRSKRREGDTEEAGWYCWAKTGGCGANWPKDTVKVVGKVENPEPWELCNTILKMSQKRALVAAILIATGGSGIWTQDVEDMPSVAGDNVIDAEYTTAPQRAAEPADVVRSADDRLWKRWLNILGEAQSLNVPVAQPRLPMSRAELTKLGTETVAAIARRKEHIPVSGTTSAAAQPPAAVEAAPAEIPSSSAGSPLVSDKNHKLWKAWLAAESAARKAGFEGDTSNVHLGISESELQAAIDTLLSDVEAT